MKLNIGGITEAGLSKANLTGSWRYQFPAINPELCNICGLCELFCPDSSVNIAKNAVTVKEEYCKGCGICAKECHRNAITMILEGEK